MTSELVSRAGWGARPANGRPTNITPQGITVHYWGSSPWSHGIGDHSVCPAIVRGGQAYHMDGHGWLDIAYTSLVCPHGVRYEGRGPGVRTAANGTNDGNQRSYAVCYLGGDGDALTDVAKAAYYDEQARLGVPLKWGHREWLSTGCPGSPLWAWRQAGFPIGAAPQPAPAPAPSPAPAPAPSPRTPPDHMGIFPLPAGHWFGTYNATEARNHSGRTNGTDRSSINRIMDQLRGRGWGGVPVNVSEYTAAVKDIVVKYQRDAGLAQDGACGSITWNNMRTRPVT